MDLTCCVECTQQVHSVMLTEYYNIVVERCEPFQKMLCNEATLESEEEQYCSVVPSIC